MEKKCCGNCLYWNQVFLNAGRCGNAKNEFNDLTNIKNYYDYCPNWWLSHEFIEE